MKNKVNEILVVKGGVRGEIEGIEVIVSDLGFEEFCKGYGESIKKETFDDLIDCEYSVEEVEGIIEELRIGNVDFEVGKSGMIYCSVGVSEEEGDCIILGSSLEKKDRKDLLNEDKDFCWDEIISRLVE